MGNIDADRLQREMMDIAYLDDIPACSSDNLGFIMPSGHATIGSMLL